MILRLAIYTAVVSNYCYLYLCYYISYHPSYKCCGDIYKLVPSNSVSWASVNLYSVPFACSTLCCYINIAVADVTKKWANLRTQCLKEHNLLKKRKPSGSGYDDDITIVTSKWKYFIMLKFLLPTFNNTTQRKSNLTVS